METQVSLKPSGGSGDDGSVGTSVLIQCFQGTVDPNGDIRQQCEAKLKVFSVEHGFLPKCLEVMNYELPNDLKLIIAIYFKNQVKLWARVSEGDKHVVKQALLPFINASPYNIKQQFIAVLRVVISVEFPGKWLEVLNDLGGYLMKEDINDVYTGLVTLLEITKKFKWNENSKRQLILDPIIEQSFPVLLNIGNILVEKSHDLTEFHSEVLKLIVKVFKSVTYFDFPMVLQASLIPWSEFHGKLINMALPQYIFTYDEAERNLLQLPKVLKWAFANLNRIIRRYVTGKFNYKVIELIYINDFLPYLTENILHIIELWLQDAKWLNTSAVNNLNDLMVSLISIPKIWPMIHPCSENLLSMVYKYMMLSDYRLELFELNPLEYIQLNDSNSEILSINLLVKLFNKKVPIKQFIYRQFNLANDDSLESARRKDSLLRMISSISFLINDKDVEQFLIEYVAPNFHSHHHFLVARTFEVFGKFSDLEYESQNLNILIYEILKNFHNDQEQNIVINFENCLIIQSYLHIEEFKTNLSMVIVPVMSRLLTLANEIDNDNISVVMQECIENFLDQLQPFGIELIKKLIENFLNVIYEEDNDKIISGIGILNTIITILLSFENNKHIIGQIIELLLPMIKIVLINENDNYLSEICEIIENLIYLNKGVTQELWIVLEHLVDLVESGVGLMYFEELLPSLKNYLLYGDVQNHAMKFIKIFAIINKSDNVSDLNNNFELIQYFILALKMNSVNYIPTIITQISTVTSKGNLLYKINFNNIFVTSMIYDTNLMVFLLKEKFSFLLTNWFKLIPKLSRCYDLKLSILGLISLINNENVANNEMFSQKLISLIKRLPSSMNELNKRKQRLNEGMLDYGDFDEDYEDYEEEEEEEDYEQTEDNTLAQETQETTENGGQNDYLDFLTRESYKFSDEEIIEDPFEVTPIDNINFQDLLTNFFHLLSSNDEGTLMLFQSSMNELNEAIAKIQS